MKTSARNQLPGQIKAVKHGPVSSEITLQLANGVELVASITEESCRELGLAEGGMATALIKAGSIIVATDLHPMKLSARNQFHGIITQVERGAVNSIVGIDIGGGLTLTAGITMHSAETLDLHPGQRATAVFKAGSVILGVLA
ncbi:MULTISPECIES: molybdopterin-binding protein [Eikenella]|uniref:Transporter n=1 Tax=Eikenella longinqua TaxID=1795827 RepID=A0A1A9S1J2_9NEIS|nr:MULTISPECIES: TOBE domain-containing protein [Eikenella]OAM30814.1 transporter [Eikenella longinqua]